MAERTKTVQKATDADSVISRVYEVGYHILPTVAEENVEQHVSAIRTVIEKAGGSFITEGAPALTKLSYAISMHENGKNTEYDRGYFGWLKFEAPTTAAGAIEDALKADKTIMRHILFQTVREETRARAKLGSLREVRREGAAAKTVATPRREEEAAPVSEAELDKALEDITAA